MWFKTESKDLDFPNLAADSPDLEVPSPTLPWAGGGGGGRLWGWNQPQILAEAQILCLCPLAVYPGKKSLYQMVTKL